MAEPIRIPTEDGFSLGGHHHAARGQPRGWVVLSSAMGVEQGYYAAFAAHLAERGFHALTWDYRGIGASRPAPEGRFGLMAWAQLDMEAALGWALRRGGPVMVVGHSLGTQLLGFARSAPEVAAVVGVGSQSGDWRHWPFPSDLVMFLLSHLVLPALGTLLGRVPKGLMGEEIPGGPILHWARWIRSRGYLLSEGEHVPPLFERLTCPITGISIDDDRYAPRHAVDALYRIYARARVERLHLVPGDYGVPAIGHFGPFRRRFRDTLWPVLLRPLEAAAGRRNGAA